MNGRGISTLWMLVLLTAAPAAWAQPVVSFAPPEVVASGVTAGGSAVFFAVARELGEDGGTTVVVRRSVAADEDGDGVVAYDLGGEPALRSLWTASDLASGAVGLGMVEGFERADIPPEQVALVAGPEMDRLWVDREVVEIVVLRVGAGGGAWGLTVGDGGVGDGDTGVEGQVEAELSSFTGVGEGAPAPPAAYQAGDLVLIVDPRPMAVYVGRVESSGTELIGGLVLVPLLGGAS